MGTVYNANAVKDGMVLCLDAGNAKTYPGSGTSFYSANKQAIVGALNGISVANYTPASGGLQAKAFVFTSGGTAFPTIAYSSSLFGFRNNISWDCVVCKESNTGRQSVFAQIGTISPWNGMGLVSVSHDSNGQLAWWGGNYVTSGGDWWDTGLSPAINKWVYIAGTWSSTTQTVYLRGHGDSSMSSAVSTTLGPFTGTDVNNSFRLGENGDGTVGAGTAANIIDGAVVLVRVWSVALSSTQVNQNFNSIRGRFGL